MCDLKNELEIDENTLTSMIQGTEDFAIVNSEGIYQVSRHNDEFIQFLFHERKRVMTQNININRDEKQWSLL